LIPLTLAVFVDSELMQRCLIVVVAICDCSFDAHNGLLVSGISSPAEGFDKGLASGWICHVNAVGRVGLSDIWCRIKMLLPLCVAHVLVGRSVCEST